MPRTYSEMYIALRNRLRDAGIEAAALEARLIAATAAGKSTEKLRRDMRYYATDEVEKRAEAMVRRRLAGEPVAYITGVWEFRGLPMEDVYKRQGQRVQNWIFFVFQPSSLRLSSLR